MKVNIQKTKNRFISILGAVFVFVSCLLFPVSAVDANGNEFIDPDDYVEYSFSDDKTIVFTNYNFPTEWIESCIYEQSFSGIHLIERAYGSSVKYSSLARGAQLRIRPFRGKLSSGSPVGTQTKDGYIFDITAFPGNINFHSSFTVRLDMLAGVAPQADELHGYLYSYFVDANGVVVERHQKYIKPLQVAYDGSYCVVAYEYDVPLSLYSLPDDAVGFLPVYELYDKVDIGDFRIDSVTYDGLSFSYALSDLEYEVQQNNALKNTMKNIQSALAEQDKKLDNILTGTPEMNQAVDGALDNISGAGDKLGDLGDSMSAVEKPDGNSIKADLGSLIDPAMFMVFTAPFHRLWENDTLLSIITVVLTLVIVSWVFFGKKK